jgi:hypothetical protein
MLGRNSPFRNEELSDLADYEVRDPGFFSRYFYVSKNPQVRVTLEYTSFNE